ncbi:uncharacterized protein LOC113793042 [Dermatophagoides pteronyssinus]|uniref:uncharacterized protein LOC113793042 n=1 Tax=Dermatophagoides pteronyssinus TaxID=6956 RepID=UPI003F668F0E
MDQRLPPLNRDNWTEWKTKSKIILTRLNIWSFVNDDQPPEKHKALDDAIIDMILLSIEDNSLISLAKNCTTSNQLWRTLSEHFERSTTNHNLDIKPKDENCDSFSIASQNKPEIRNIHTQTSMLNIPNSLRLPDDFEELFVLVQQLEIKLIETLSEINDESLIIEKSNMVRLQFLDFIDVVENFCTPTISDKKQSIKNNSNLLNDISKFEPCKIEANSQTHSPSDKSKPKEIGCQNSIISETIMTYVNNDSLLDDQHNKIENEEVIDEILVYFKDSSSATVVDNERSLPLDAVTDNFTWLQTNDINLWSRLLILDPKFLSNLHKFYCHYCGEYWLFDADGNVFRYGHRDRSKENFETIDPPILMKELCNKPIKSIVSCKNYKSFWSMILTYTGQLYAIGDNSLGQLGIGNKETQDYPILISKNISKVSCGLFHALALTHDGRVLSSGSNLFFQNGNKIHGQNNLTLAVIELFQDDIVIDIACTMNASLILKKTREIWLFGSVNKAVFYPPRFVSFDSFVTRIIGGQQEFIVLSNNFAQNHNDSASDQAHIYQIADEKKLVRNNINLDSRSKIIDVYQQNYFNNYIFVTNDGLCHIYKHEDRANFPIPFLSVPDVFSLFLYPQTGSIIHLPKKLVNNPESIPTLNNPKTADIIFKFSNMNVLYAERQRLIGRSHFWYESLTDGQWSIKYPATIHYEFLPFYLYLRHVYEMPELQIIDLQNSIQELRKLATDFEDNDFLSYLDNFVDRNAKKPILN